MEVKETIVTEITASSTTRGCKRRAQHEIQVKVTKKQKLEVNSVASSSSNPKPAKVHPLFAPISVRKNEFRFLKRKPRETVLHGVHLSPDPKGVKIAAFDLDGTLISTKTGFIFPNGADDWKWWNDLVPTRLKELHDDGYAIVIMSNQGGLSGNSRKRKEQWEAKIGLIAKEIPEVPFRIFAATEEDEHRKPRAGMWNLLSALYSKQGITIDLDQSFYVGDAAGRPGDHSNSDKGLAAAIGLSFHTPEEFFPSPADA